MLRVTKALSLSSRIAAAAGLTGCLLVPAVASATGTINIQHANGSVKTYRDVEIKVFAGSLFLTSDDGNGTIVVTRAACSYREKIIVCLPTTAALVQGGSSHALDLKTGTIYLNYTNAEQPLSHTSTRIPGNSILLALSMNNGTYINVRGRIDELVKQQ
jgi:hypothetical protein